MGTPAFSAPILRMLVEEGYNVLAVVTQPDRPVGRKKVLTAPPVKEEALKLGLPVIQPTKLKGSPELEEIIALAPDLIVTAAFGQLLPKELLDAPTLGCINVHASLLPNYRGAAPINWAIINGETKTGVSTFFIDEKIDTGNIILQEEVIIGDDETLGELHDKLMEVGSKLVVKTVQQIEKGIVKTIKQPEIEEKSAPKIFTETCKINWNDSLTNIYNLIRGLNPYPAAWTSLINNNEEIKAKIYGVKKESASHQHTPGTVITSKNEIKVAVNGGYIILESLQLAGKKQMDSKSLLNGFRFHENAHMQ